MVQNKIKIKSINDSSQLELTCMYIIINSIHLKDYIKLLLNSG